MVIENERRLAWINSGLALAYYGAGYLAAQAELGIIVGLCVGVGGFTAWRAARFFGKNSAV